MLNHKAFEKKISKCVDNVLSVLDENENVINESLKIVKSLNLKSEARKKLEAFFRA